MSSQTGSPSLPDISKSTELYERAKNLIPTGTMLLSKRPERIAPGRWPAYYKRAWGCQVEDIDGNVFVDFTGDVGATMLGRADPDVNAAVHAVVDQGSFCTLNYPREVELAELLTRIIPCAQQYRRVLGGGEADMVAVRIARGYTKRDKVAFCGYHGWHDWYLAANLADDSVLDEHLLPGLKPRGVPRPLVNTAMPFNYNDLDALKDILESNTGQVAAIIMEATRHYRPNKGFLEGVRQLADQHGAVLIFDEVVTGFRMALGGAQEYFGVTPDLAVFAKTISNGYPMGAVVGRRDVMNTVNEQFISSTYWTDAVGTAAALATIEKMRRIGVVEYIWDLGKELSAGLSEALEKAGIKGNILGWPSHPILSLTGHDGEVGGAMATFFVRGQLARGYLTTGTHFLTAAHTKDDIHKYLMAAEETFKELKASMDRGTVMEDIDNSPGQSLFKRLA